jgi:IclR family pca regulon transcriptional regulator
MLSLARGLAVIRAFGDGRTALTIADAARSTGLSRAATRRCLHTLSVLGYVSGRRGTFELTPAILALGYAYLGSASIARVAQPILEQFSEDVHESSSLAVLDGDEIVYLARAATRRILSIALSAGSRLPAAVTSMGRVLVAFGGAPARDAFVLGAALTRYTARTIVGRDDLRRELDRVRARGYALVDQELEIGLRSLAVPVRRPDGEVVAAINVGVHAGRADARALVRDFLPGLRLAAEKIQTAMGDFR